jgi:hypothetical protein
VDRYQHRARVRNFATQAEHAPSVGQRLTSHHVDDGGEAAFAAEFGHDPWEVAEVVPIEDCPGWVRVYVEVVGTVTPPWEGLTVPLR